MARDRRSEDVEALFKEVRALQDRFRDLGSAAAWRAPGNAADDG